MSTARDPRTVHGGLALLAVIVVSASWQWGYRPARAAPRAAGERLAQLSDQIAAVNEMVRGSGGQAAWLAEQERRRSDVRGRFRGQAEIPQLLSTLVDTLGAGEITLQSVTQGNLAAVQEGERPVLIDGVPCFRLPVTVIAEGRYHAVRAALERVMLEPFPGVVGLQEAVLRLQGTTGSTLEATLVLSLYVTVTEPVAAPEGGSANGRTLESTRPVRPGGADA